MASLHIAFHLIRQGADPRQVDPGVRNKALAEHQRRAAADDDDDMRPFAVEEKAALEDFASGPHGGDDDLALLRACQKPGVYTHGLGTDSYDLHLSRRP
ncbi:hypothetical protein PG991_002023 [Apiospora marii]|uniref:Uncharacterized protein n=1 Tax=Apiospora marii TaxID=335849 RepID=A0ABR1SNQ2_9PEZI